MSIKVTALFLLYSSSAQELDHQKTISKFVVDYVQFYRSVSVNLLLPAGRTNQWEIITYRWLTSLTRVYINVLKPNFKNYTSEVDYLTALDNAFNNSSLPSIPLTVLHLQEKEHAVLFGKVLSRMSTWRTWLLLLPEHRLTEWLTDVFFPPDNRVTVATYSRTPDSVVFLWQFYQISPQMNKKMLPSGGWTLLTSEFDMKLNCTDIEWQSNEMIQRRKVSFGKMLAEVGDPLLRRINLTGLHLLCTTMNEYPRTVLHQTPDGKVMVDGILGGIIHYMQKITNFTFSCRLPVDRQWGSVDDGTWTGMVGEVYRGAATIAFAALDATPERRSAVDFLLPISDTDYLLTVRQPSNNDKTWSIYSEEFSSDVWIFVAGAMILLVIGLYISATNIQDEERLSASDSFFIVLGALCGQGCCWKPVRFPGRLMLLTIMGLHVILLAHYTSNLVSSLSVQPSLPSISSIEDIFQNPKFNLLVKKGTASVEYLKESLRSDHWKSLLSRGEEALVTTNEEGMSKVLENNYAYLSPNSFLFNEYAQDCRIHIVPKPQFKKENSFAMRKGSPLIRIFNAIIVKMKESGVMSQLERRWMKELSECHIETTIISITTVSSPFVLLLFTLLCSFIICFLEIVIAKKKLFT